MATISRQQYNDLYGPTVGDKIRLGDTDLYVEITKDLCVYGDEVVYGGGKTLRDGMGLANTTTSEGGTLDLVITNVTIIDPILGVIKADVGVKDGKTITSGTWNMKRMLQSIDGLPVNYGFLGKGNCSVRRPLVEQMLAGACGFKIHEDWGSTPAAIRATMAVADEFDVQVAIHTDTLNEGGYVEDTIAAIDGRTIHTYHTEGAFSGKCTSVFYQSYAAVRYQFPG